MRQFYIIFSNEKVSQLATQLSWSHYIEICIAQRLGRDYLREKIRNKEYKRIPVEARNKLIKNEKMEVKDLVPNPILIRNKNNIDIINEKALHNLILDDIESFMHELGSNFSFIGSEYKIKIGDAITIKS